MYDAIITSLKELRSDPAINIWTTLGLVGGV